VVVMRRQVTAFQHPPCIPLPQSLLSEAAKSSGHFDRPFSPQWGKR